MTRDPFVDPQDDRLTEFFDEARTALIETPSPAVERRHLTAMVEAFQASDTLRSTAHRRTGLMNRILAIGAVKALVVAFAALVATGSALAATGSLPDPAQDVVANSVDNVGLDIPGGDDEAEVADDEQEESDDQEADEEGTENEEGDQAGEPQGPPARATTPDCPNFEGNHGEYVSGTEEHPRSDAAHSDCGKPVQATHQDGEDEQEVEHGESSEHRGDDGDEQGEEELEHGQGGPHGESSSGDGS